MAQNLTRFRKKNLPNYCLKIEQEQQKCNSIDDNLSLFKENLLDRTFFYILIVSCLDEFAEETANEDGNLKSIEVNTVVFKSILNG